MPFETLFSQFEKSLRFAVFLLAPIFFLSACTWTKLSDEGFNRPELIADANKGVALRLADYTSFTWDRVYIFGPHTPDDVVTKEVGRSVPFSHVNSERHCLLVFLNHGEIAAAFELETKPADFSKLYRKGGYSRSEAVFTFENGQFYQWRDNRKEVLKSLDYFNVESYSSVFPELRVAPSGRSGTYKSESFDSRPTSI